MTETVATPEISEPILEAVELIDRGLGELADRSLFSADEVADLLLDVRRLLTKPDEVSVN